jgi:hypothetical protein
MFRSLVSLVSSWPVLRSSRLPKLNVCIFLKMASRRSASKLRDALTEKYVLAIDSAALRMLAPIIRRLVHRMTLMSCLATPSSMMTWTNRGIERSATTTRANRIVARAASFL